MTRSRRDLGAVRASLISLVIGLDLSLYDIRDIVVRWSPRVPAPLAGTLSGRRGSALAELIATWPEEVVLSAILGILRALRERIPAGVWEKTLREAKHVIVNPGRRAPFGVLAEFRRFAEVLAGG